MAGVAVNEQMSIRTFLEAAQPDWSLKAVDSAEEKLGKIAIHTVSSLIATINKKGKANINKRLWAVGQKAFTQDTLNSFKRSWKVLLEDQQQPLGYGDGPEFWNQYFQNGKPFDWLQDYAELHDIIEDATEGLHSSRILHTGCGSSTLPEKLYDDGYRSITNVDNSGVVIRQMIERNTHRSEMTWLEMDATHMTFGDSAFDIVIDKGLLDALYCMVIDRNALSNRYCKDNSTRVIAAYLKEVVRVLAPGGTFVCISFGAPDKRLGFLEMQQWTVNFIEIPSQDPSGKANYAYICARSKTLEAAVTRPGCYV